MPRFDAVFFDLDGTVYHAGSAIDGARELLARLREEDVPYLFLTNRANLTPAFIAGRLREQEIDCADEDVLTAATATSTALAAEKAGGSAFVVGEEALFETLHDQGISTLSVDVLPENEEETPDWVVVGIDPGITYEKISRAVQWILRGAAFIATNTDRLTTGPGGVKRAGAGAIVAAIGTSASVEPRIIGKPRTALFEIALRKLAEAGRDCAPERILMVGDNLMTDIAGGEAAGQPTAFILTGVSAREDIGRLGIEPTYVADDYSALTELIFSDS